MCDLRLRPYFRNTYDLIKLPRGTHEETQPVNQDYQRYKYKVERAGDYPGDGHPLAAILSGIILDLKQREDA